MARPSDATSRSAASRWVSTIARLAARSVSGALAAMVAAYLAVNVSSSAFGTTWFTSPMRCASTAV